ncbi:competence/damage-inducible protein A [bacterium]|nr:competence/damage-inducible protein A [bacterium]
MRAVILTIGDELLSGITVNTNASFIAGRLTELGIRVARILALPDSEEAIVEALHTAIQDSELTVLTGGLGPTRDDVTQKALCRFFHCGLVFRQDVWDAIVDRFRRMGRDLPESNRVQAEVPEIAEILPNPRGTAPGLYFKHDGRLLFALPGVPYEMKAMMADSVLPRLERLPRSRSVHFHNIHTAGISESGLADLLDGFYARFPETGLAFLPSLSGVTLRLMAEDAPGRPGADLLERARAFVLKKAGEWRYGEKNDTLEQVTGNLLIQKGLSLSVAESCTGGLLSHKLTQIPGSSAYLNRTIVAYSNQAKKDLLGVPASLLEKYGAVSRETAAAMAEGVRKDSGTDLGLSVTGIAGPGGGTVEKPVGLVFTGVSDGARTLVEENRFIQDREVNKERSAYAALNLLRRFVLGKI